MRKLIFLLGLFAPLICFCQWTQLGSTLEGTISEQGAFGYDVAVSADGTTMVVGAPDAAGFNFENNSYVEVYRYVDDDWELLGDRIEGADHFISSRTAPKVGYAVDISHDGNLIAVGEINYYTVHEDLLTPQNGRVRVFNYVNENWEQVGGDIMGVQLDSNGNYDLFDTGHNGFGRSLALSGDGNILAIGDFGASNPNGVDTGQVTVFQNINNQWVPLGGELYGEIEDEDFGKAIDISSDGTILAVGALEGAGDVPGPNPGYVNIYEYQDNNWQLIGHIEGLESNDGWGRGNYAGSSVALSDDGTRVAFSGSQYRNSNGDFVGNVRVYQNVSSNWQQVGSMLEGARSSHVNTKSMVDLSADGNILAFGTSDASPRVEVYQNVNNEWQLVDDIILPESLDEQNTFGRVVSLSADGSILGLGIFGATVRGMNGIGIAKVLQNCNLNQISVFAEETTALCEGSNTTLLAAIEQDYYIEGGVIHWYTNQTETEPVYTGSTYDTPELSETTSFWVEALSPTGCPSERVEVEVIVNDKVVPNIIFSYSEICTIETAAQPILSPNFTTGGEFHATGSINIDSITGIIDASNSNPGTYVVSYEINEDLDNCLEAGLFETEVTINTCVIQRGISPNEDSLNDYFDLTGLGVKILKIYNRYGKELYSKVNYTNEWDGKDNSGNKLPTGTYFYSIHKNDGEQLTGWVYINREL